MGVDEKLNLALGVEFVVSPDAMPKELGRDLKTATGLVEQLNKEIVELNVNASNMDAPQKLAERLKNMSPALKTFTKGAGALQQAVKGQISSLLDNAKRQDDVMHKKLATSWINTMHQAEMAQYAYNTGATEMAENAFRSAQAHAKEYETQLATMKSAGNGEHLVSQVSGLTKLLRAVVTEPAELMKKKNAEAKKVATSFRESVVTATKNSEYNIFPKYRETLANLQNAGATGSGGAQSSTVGELGMIKEALDAKLINFEKYLIAEKNAINAIPLMGTTATVVGTALDQMKQALNAKIKDMYDKMNTERDLIEAKPTPPIEPLASSLVSVQKLVTDRLNNLARIVNEINLALGGTATPVTSGEIVKEKVKKVKDTGEKTLADTSKSTTHAAKITTKAIDTQTIINTNAQALHDRLATSGKNILEFSAKLFGREIPAEVAAALSTRMETDLKNLKSDFSELLNAKKNGKAYKQVDLDAIESKIAFGISGMVGKARELLAGYAGTTKETGQFNALVATEQNLLAADLTKVLQDMVRQKFANVKAAVKSAAPAAGASADATGSAAAPTAAPIPKDIPQLPLASTMAVADKGIYLSVAEMRYRQDRKALAKSRASLEELKEKIFKTNPDVDLDEHAGYQSALRGHEQDFRDEAMKSRDAVQRMRKDDFSVAFQDVIRGNRNKIVAMMEKGLDTDTAEVKQLRKLFLETNRPSQHLTNRIHNLEEEIRGNEERIKNVNPEEATRLQSLIKRQREGLASALDQVNARVQQNNEILGLFGGRTPTTQTSYWDSGSLEDYKYKETEANRFQMPTVTKVGEKPAAKAAPKPAPKAEKAEDTTKKAADTVEKLPTEEEAPVSKIVTNLEKLKKAVNKQINAAKKEVTFELEATSEFKFDESTASLIAPKLKELEVAINGKMTSLIAPLNAALETLGPVTPEVKGAKAKKKKAKDDLVLDQATITSLNSSLTTLRTTIVGEVISLANQLKAVVPADQPDTQHFTDVNLNESLQKIDAAIKTTLANIRAVATTARNFRQIKLSAIPAASEINAQIRALDNAVATALRGITTSLDAATVASTATGSETVSKEVAATLASQVEKKMQRIRVATSKNILAIVEGFRTALINVKPTDEKTAEVAAIKAALVKLQEHIYTNLVVELKTFTTGFNFEADTAVQTKAKEALAELKERKKAFFTSLVSEVKAYRRKFPVDKNEASGVQLVESMVELIKLRTNLHEKIMSEMSSYVFHLKNANKTAASAETMSDLATLSKDIRDTRQNLYNGVHKEFTSIKTALTIATTAITSPGNLNVLARELVKTHDQVSQMASKSLKSQRETLGSVLPQVTLGTTLPADTDASQRRLLQEVTKTAPKDNSLRNRLGSYATSLREQSTQIVRAGIDELSRDTTLTDIFKKRGNFHIEPITTTFNALTDSLIKQQTTSFATQLEGLKTVANSEPVTDTNRGTLFDLYKPIMANMSSASREAAFNSLNQTVKATFPDDKELHQVVDALTKNVLTSVKIEEPTVMTETQKKIQTEAQNLALSISKQFESFAVRAAREISQELQKATHAALKQVKLVATRSGPDVAEHAAALTPPPPAPVKPEEEAKATAKKIERVKKYVRPETTTTPQARLDAALLAEKTISNEFRGVQPAFVKNRMLRSYRDQEDAADTTRANLHKELVRVSNAPGDNVAAIEKARADYQAAADAHAALRANRETRVPNPKYAEWKAREEAVAVELTRLADVIRLAREEIALGTAANKFTGRVTPGKFSAGVTSSDYQLRLSAAREEAELARIATEEQAKQVRATKLDAYKTRLNGPIFAPTDRIPYDPSNPDQPDVGRPAKLMALSNTSSPLISSDGKYTLETHPKPVSAPTHVPQIEDLFNSYFGLTKDSKHTAITTYLQDMLDTRPRDATGGYMTEQGRILHQFTDGLNKEYTATVSDLKSHIVNAIETNGGGAASDKQIRAIQSMFSYLEGSHGGPTPANPTGSMPGNPLGANVLATDVFGPSFDTQSAASLLDKLGSIAKAARLVRKIDENLKITNLAEHEADLKSLVDAKATMQDKTATVAAREEARTMKRETEARMNKQQIERAYQIQKVLADEVLSMLPTFKDLGTDGAQVATNLRKTVERRVQVFAQQMARLSPGMEQEHLMVAGASTFSQNPVNLSMYGLDEATIAKFVERTGGKTTQTTTAAINSINRIQELLGPRLQSLMRQMARRDIKSQDAMTIDERLASRTHLDATLAELKNVLQVGKVGTDITSADANKVRLAKQFDVFQRAITADEGMANSILAATKLMMEPNATDSGDAFVQDSLRNVALQKLASDGQRTGKSKELLTAMQRVRASANQIHASTSSSAYTEQFYGAANVDKLLAGPGGNNPAILNSLENMRQAGEAGSTSVREVATKIAAALGELAKVGNVEGADIATAFNRIRDALRSVDFKALSPEDKVAFSRVAQNAAKMRLNLNDSFASSSNFDSIKGITDLSQLYQYNKETGTTSRSAIAKEVLKTQLVDDSSLDAFVANFRRFIKKASDMPPTIRDILMSEADNLYTGAKSFEQVLGPHMRDAVMAGGLPELTDIVSSGRQHLASTGQRRATTNAFKTVNSVSEATSSLMTAQLEELQSSGQISEASAKKAAKKIDSYTNNLHNVMSELIKLGKLLDKDTAELDAFHNEFAAALKTGDANAFAALRKRVQNYAPEAQVVGAGIVRQGETAADISQTYQKDYERTQALTTRYDATRSALAGNRVISGNIVDPTALQRADQAMLKLLQYTELETKSVDELAAAFRRARDGQIAFAGLAGENAQKINLLAQSAAFNYAKAGNTEKNAPLLRSKNILTNDLFHQAYSYTIGMSMYRGMDKVMAYVPRAMDYQKKLSELQTLTQQAPISENAWSDMMMQLSSANNVDLLDQTEAAYQAISNQVIQAGNAFKYLASTNQLANATLSKSSTANNAVSSMLKAYGLTTESTDEVSAKLFQAVNFGRFRLSDVADNIGQVSITSHQLGVKDTEMLAALSAMTVQGIGPAESMTLLRNVVMRLAKPTENLQKFFVKLGVSSGEAAIRTYGLVGTMQELEKFTRGSTDELADMFDRIRSVTGAAALFKDGGAQFREFEKGIRESSTYYKRAVDIVQSTDSFKTESYWRSLDNTVTGIVHGWVKEIKDFSALVTQSPGASLAVIGAMGSAYMINWGGIRAKGQNVRENAALMANRQNTAFLEANPGMSVPAHIAKQQEQQYRDMYLYGPHVAGFQGSSPENQLQMYRSGQVSAKKALFPTFTGKPTWDGFTQGVGDHWRGAKESMVNIGALKVGENPLMSASLGITTFITTYGLASEAIRKFGTNYEETAKAVVSYTEEMKRAAETLYSKYAQIQEKFKHQTESMTKLMGTAERIFADRTGVLSGGSGAALAQFADANQQQLKLLEQTKELRNELSQVTKESATGFESIKKMNQEFAEKIKMAGFETRYGTDLKGLSDHYIREMETRSKSIVEFQEKSVAVKARVEKSIRDQTANTQAMDKNEMELQAIRAKYHGNAVMSAPDKQRSDYLVEQNTLLAGKQVESLQEQEIATRSQADAFDELKDKLKEYVDFSSKAHDVMQKAQQEQYNIRVKIFDLTMKQKREELDYYKQLRGVQVTELDLRHEAYVTALKTGFRMQNRGESTQHYYQQLDIRKDQVAARMGQEATPSLEGRLFTAQTDRYVIKAQQDLNKRQGGRDKFLLDQQSNLAALNIQELQKKLADNSVALGQLTSQMANFPEIQKNQEHNAKYDEILKQAQGLMKEYNEGKLDSYEKAVDWDARRTGLISRMKSVQENDKARLSPYYKAQFGEIEQALPEKVGKTAILKGTLNSKLKDLTEEQNKRDAEMTRLTGDLKGVEESTNILSNSAKQLSILGGEFTIGLDEWYVGNLQAEYKRYKDKVLANKGTPDDYATWKGTQSADFRHLNKENTLASQRTLLQDHPENLQMNTGLFAGYFGDKPGFTADLIKERQVGFNAGAQEYLRGVGYTQRDIDSQNNSYKLKTLITEVGMLGQKYSTPESFQNADIRDYKFLKYAKAYFDANADVLKKQFEGTQYSPILDSSRLIGEQISKLEPHFTDKGAKLTQEAGLLKILTSESTVNDEKRKVMIKELEKNFGITATTQLSTANITLGSIDKQTGEVLKVLQDLKALYPQASPDMQKAKAAEDAKNATDAANAAKAGKPVTYDFGTPTPFAEGIPTYVTAQGPVDPWLPVADQVTPNTDYSSSTYMPPSAGVTVNTDSVTNNSTVLGDINVSVTTEGLNMSPDELVTAVANGIASRIRRGTFLPLPTK